jgi:hypothetical protein
VGFLAIQYFSFSGYSLFVVNKKSSLFIHSCRENFHTFASKFVQLLHQTALININTGLIFSHIFQVTCILHELRFSQHAAEESSLLPHGTATMGRLFPAHQR